MSGSRGARAPGRLCRAARSRRGAPPSSSSARRSSDHLRSGLCRARDSLGSAEIFDDADELCGLVALVAGEVEEVSGPFDHGATFRGAGDGDAAAAAELEQALVAELAESAEDGVGVDLEDGCEVFRGWEAFAGFGFA